MLDDILIVRMRTVCMTLGKIKQSLYQPGLALPVPGGDASRFRHLAHERGKVVSPTHWPL